MRFLTSLSLIALIVPLTLAAGVGSSSIITSAYAKNNIWQDGDHGASYQAPIEDKKLALPVREVID